MVIDGISFSVRCYPHLSTTTFYLDGQLNVIEGIHLTRRSILAYLREFDFVLPALDQKAVN